MDQRTELSEFLRSRRARLRPEDVGLAHYGGRRRVPGLRREELAQLAGVSAAYYTRLEQGHGENVSTTVLDAISGALRLGQAEREHLARLVRPVRRRGYTATKPQVLRPELQNLMDTMETVPAYVVGRWLDVLGWNRAAAALFGDFGAMPAEQRNLAWQTFRNPALQEVYADWPGKAADIVASLRLSAGRYPNDPRLGALYDELCESSEDFRRLWDTHNVSEKGHCAKELRHPVAGPLTLQHEAFRLPGDPDQTLCTYHAEPGSPSAEALRLLTTGTLQSA